MKETEEDTNRWEDKPRSWIGRINIIKMTIISKEVHSFRTITIKLAMELEHNQNKKILKFVWRH